MCGRGKVGGGRLVRCDCPLLLSVLEVDSDLSFHPLALILIGSARRKLTCTICNRKCSSSLNLQEHRKVSPKHTRRSERIYSAHAVLHDPVLQRRDVPSRPCPPMQWDPSHSFPARPLNRALRSSGYKYIPGDNELRAAFFFTSSSHSSCEI